MLLKTHGVCLTEEQTMRNKHLFEQFMKENELEYNAPFTVKIDYGNKVETKELEIRKSSFAGRNFISLDIVNNALPDEKYTLGELVFSGDIKIVKKSYKPKYDDIYWYASIDGRVYSTTWTDHNNDMHRYVLGNCFKTKEEAQKHKCDVFGILDGGPLIKWEE